jgi:hypothetical protein
MQKRFIPAKDNRELLETHDWKREEDDPEYSQSYGTKVEFTEAYTVR